MASGDALSHTPYYFLARRPFREERLASFISRQHRLGRHLSEILEDPYIRRIGSSELVWQTLRNTKLIDLLETDIREAFEGAAQDL